MVEIYIYRGLVMAANNLKTPYCCYLFIILFLFHSKLAFAENTQKQTSDKNTIWITTGFLSYHPNRNPDYNERNTGIGGEYHFDDERSLALGHYKNSVRKQSTYLQYVYTPVAIGNIKLGGALGIVDGYPKLRDGKFTPVLLPVASTTFKVFGQNMGLNFVYIPSLIPDTDSSFAVQFKLAVY